MGKHENRYAQVNGDSRIDDYEESYAIYDTLQDIVTESLNGVRLHAGRHVAFPTGETFAREVEALQEHFLT